METLFDIERRLGGKIVLTVCAYELVAMAAKSQGIPLPPLSELSQHYRWIGPAMCGWMGLHFLRYWKEAQESK